MRLYKKHKFFIDTIKYKQGGILFQIFVTFFLIFSMHIIIYNTFDIINCYFATKSINRGLYNVETNNIQELQDDLEPIGHLIEKTNTSIPTNEKSDFSKSTNYTIFTYSNEMKDEFPMPLSKSDLEDVTDTNVYNAIVDNKSSVQYKVGKEYDVELNDGETIGINIIGILKWDYWFNDGGFGKIDGSIYVYDADYALSRKYKQNSDKSVYVSCRLNDCEELEKILSENPSVVYYDDMHYDTSVWKSDKKEALQESIFAMALFILVLINMLLFNIRIFQNNQREIAIFLQNGCSLLDFLKIYIFWFLEIYVLPYMVALIASSYFVYASVDMWLKPGIEIKIAIAFLFCICVCIGYSISRIIRIKRKNK